MKSCKTQKKKLHEMCEISWGFFLFKAQVGLQAYHKLRDLSIKPFVKVVGNYTCCDRDYKGNEKIYHKTPPSVTISKKECSVTNAL